MTERRARRRGPKPAGAAVLLAGVVALAVLVAPGTLSYLQSSATASGASITTGSAALQLARTNGQTAAAVYPGGPAALIDPTTAPTLTNTGTVPLAVTAGLTAAGATAANFAGTVVLSVALQAGTTCAATPPPGTWSGVAGTTSPTLGVLAVGQAQRICVWQSLPATAPSGTFNQSANITLTLTGSQQ